MKKFALIVCALMLISMVACAADDGNLNNNGNNGINGNDGINGSQNNNVGGEIDDIIDNNMDNKTNGNVNGRPNTNEGSFN